MFLLFTLNRFNTFSGVSIAKFKQVILLGTIMYYIAYQFAGGYLMAVMVFNRLMRGKT